VQMLESLDEAKARFKPTVVSLVAPAVAGALKDCASSPPDEYYRLDLSHLVVPHKTRNMLKRARRDMSACIGKFGKEHERLVNDLIRSRRFDNAMQFIFNRLPEYVKCDTSVVFDARTTGGDLAAFTIAEYGAMQYAFYMFNCRSCNHSVPGASDLLFAHVVERAQAEGKRYINLGLGINPGIAFFKRKWGASPFLKYASCVQKSKINTSWGELFDQFA
jgi:hypothetical protein